MEFKTDKLEDDYFGSGRRINNAVKKYGIENFKKENLLFFDTYKQALDYEIEFVNEILIKDPSCYNLACGGGSWEGFNKTGNNLKTLRTCPALIDKKTKELVKPKNVEEFNKLFKTGNYFGHTKGKTTYSDFDGKIYFLDVLNEKIKELNLHGLNHNKILCKDKDGNVFWVDKNDKRIQSNELTLFWLNKKHKEESKQKIGFKNSINQKGIKNSQYGTCWITDGEKNKKIYKEDLIPSGWIKGRKMKKG